MLGKPETTLQVLTVAYISALLVLAALAIAGYFIPQNEYDNQQISDPILRAASRQQTFLERVNYLAYRLVTAREPSKRAEFRQTLTGTVNEMEKGYRRLLESNPPHSVRAIYFEPPYLLDQQMSQFIADARKIIDAPVAELSESNPHVASIRNAANGRMSAAFESVARQYEQRDEAGVLFLQRQEIGTLAASLVVLVLMGLFLFRPMVNRIGREQEALQESERRLATLLNNLPGAAYRLPRDHDGSTAYVSEGIVTLTGYEPVYFVGASVNPFDSLIVPADSPAVKKTVRQAVKRHEPYVVEYRIHTRTGKEKWLWEKGVCVRDEQGRQVALEGFIEDITRWKRAEEARVKAERLATVGSMAAKLAHEIRNPLSTIKLNLDLLGDEVEALGPGSSTITDEAKTLLNAIRCEVLRIQGVTEDYLQFTRLPKLNRGAVALEDIMSRGLNFLKPSLAASQITVVTEFGKNLPKIQGDPDQIWQAILNLIRNAIEAMPDGGALTLRTESESEEVVLQVTDTGRGMGDAERSRIFIPFFTTKPAGTGLGLALVQQIISEHGGHIDCQSAVGQGTTFSLRFPLALEPPAKA